MLRGIKQALHIVYKAGDNLVDNDGIELAGYLTFLTLLALFPFLVLVISAAGMIGQGEIGSQVIAFMITHLPGEAMSAIKPRIDEIMGGPPQGLVTLSILGAIWTSSSAVEGMRTVLNRAYQVSNPPTYVWRRMMSILQLILFMIIIIFVMAVMVLTPIILSEVERAVGQPIAPELAAIWNQYFVYFGGALLFTVVVGLYYFLPNVRLDWLAVVPGALVVVVMWIGGASFFSFYIANVDQVNIIYGSLGGFIATLLFFFIIHLILIYGAEFNNMLLHALGRTAIEKEHARFPDDIELTDHHSRQSSRPEQE